MLQVSFLFALVGVYMGDRQRFVDCNAQGKSEQLFQYLLLEIALFSLDSPSTFLSFSLLDRNIGLVCRC